MSNTIGENTGKIEKFRQFIKQGLNLAEATEKSGVAPATGKIQFYRMRKEGAVISDVKRPVVPVKAVKVKKVKVVRVKPKLNENGEPEVNVDEDEYNAN